MTRSKRRERSSSVRVGNLMTGISVLRNLDAPNWIRKIRGGLRLFQLDMSVQDCDGTDNWLLKAGAWFKINIDNWPRALVFFHQSSVVSRQEFLFSEHQSEKCYDKVCGSKTTCRRNTVILLSPLRLRE